MNRLRFTIYGALRGVPVDGGAGKHSYAAVAAGGKHSLLKNPNIERMYGECAYAVHIFCQYALLRFVDP